jgi:hypothetical protein
VWNSFGPFDWSPLSIRAVAIAADLMASHARTNVSNAAICCDKYAPRGLGVLGKFKVLLDVAIGI